MGVMPIELDLEQAIFEWQAKHGERMTYAELAKRAHISLATIYRLKSGDATKLDLKKLNRICKVLECEPGDLLKRVGTSGQSLEEAAYALQKRDNDLQEIERYWREAEQDEE
jgi:putative transcriptional regulator